MLALVTLLVSLEHAKLAKAQIRARSGVNFIWAI
jgi:hypothetical protein